LKKLLGSGKQWGLSFSYVKQPHPGGLAQAFLLGKEFIGRDRVCLILGDNIFHQEGFSKVLQRTAARRTGATVFGYWVKDPERYGVAEFDAKGRVMDLEEKPGKPKSNYAVTGLYFTIPALWGSRNASNLRKGGIGKSPTSTRPICGRANFGWNSWGAAPRGWTREPMSPFFRPPISSRSLNSARD